MKVMRLCNPVGHGCRNLRTRRETVQGAAGQAGHDVHVADGEGEVGVKRILLTRQQFPQPNDNGIRELRYTEKALLRAVVVAGQGPYSSDKTRAARADANMRRNAIVSALDMSGSNLMPTPEFVSAGSTDKATKSQYVGHALCVHAALFDLNIPWLVDIENKKLISNYKLSKKPTDQRPDFIGKDTRGKWYVFESKGRSTKPRPSNLKKWKKQAEAITHVNGKKVSQHIVSSAYFKKARGWELLWVDPVTEEDSIQFEFEDMSFFDAYYEPLRELRESGRSPLIIPEGVLFYLPMLDAYFGLHPDILVALEKREPNSITAFASNQVNFELETIDEATVSVFADGIMIALPEDLNNGKAHSPKDPHGKKPKSKAEPNSPFSAIEL